MALTASRRGRKPGFCRRHNAVAHSGIFCSAALARPARLAKLYAVSECRLIPVHGSLSATVLPDLLHHRPVVIGSVDAAKPGDSGADVRRHGRAVPTIGRRLGAGLVVSEMTASAALAEGRPDALLRAEGRGLETARGPAGRLRGALDGGRRARIAEASGAAIIDINMGCPARHVTGGQSGSALMRDLDHALTLIDATVGAVIGAGDAQDAARLG